MANRNTNTVTTSQIFASLSDESDDFLLNLDNLDGIIAASSTLQPPTNVGKQPKKCRVCGDNANNINFGAPTCESCKAFFRRNIFRYDQLKCAFDGQCVITKEKRRWCQRCRLTKCLSAGMRKELILQGEALMKRRMKRKNATLKSSDSSVASSETMVTPQENSLNVDIEEQKPTTSQLSPLVTMKFLHAMIDNRLHTANMTATADSSAAASASSSFMHETMPTQPRQHNEIQNFWSTTQQLPPPQTQSSSSFMSIAEPLSPYEFEQIWELLVANDTMLADSSADDIASYINGGETSTISGGINLLDAVNMIELYVRRFIDKAKQIAAFRNLSQTSQISILKGCCFELLTLQAVARCDFSTEVIRGPRDCAIRMDILKEARQTDDVYERVKHFVYSFEQSWRTDPCIMALLEAICLFNPDRLVTTTASDANVSEKLQVKADQATYICLLRRYLSSMCYKTDQKAAQFVFMQLQQRLEKLHQLSEPLGTMVTDINPMEIRPLLVEMFFEMNMSDQTNEF